jgi:hypothetical protein
MVRQQLKANLVVFTAESPKMPNLTLIIWKVREEQGFHISERPYTKAVSPQYITCCKVQDKNTIKD